ncbi:MAG: PIN domain-containing protein [Clostridiales bacterium]|jgi:predicted nucleic acid-binding protein|nr:PIN domain-containing protein [Clostridiales bacterium]
MTYALDTNIIIHYLRDEPNVRDKIKSVMLMGDDIIIPNVVSYEVNRGFKVQSSPKKERAYQILTEKNGFCDIVEIGSNTWKRAEEVYEKLYRKCLTVGELDILIAAFCLEYGCTLVTNNVKHFKDIDGLIIEDWLG